MKMTSKSTRAAAIVLAGSMAAGGLAAVPSAAAATQATQGPRATITQPRPAALAAATATPTPAPATLMNVSGPTNRGGVVTVSGTGFMPGETINLTLSGVTGAATMAKADAKGLLPATGVSVPYSLKPGSYTLTATGAASKRAATTPITIAALAPTITASASSAAPGASETITGKGFGSQEQVTLSLNGEALTTSPAVITTTNGAFTAMVTVPSSVLRGLNTISALGNESRVSAITSLTGNLARTPQYYIAGGVNTVQEPGFIDLLNTNAQPASVRLTFYFANRAAFTRIVTVNGSSQQRIPTANLSLPEGRFGLQVKSDRAVTASIVRTRGGKDGDVINGAPALATRWYLAAGSTKGTFQERVSILNPDPSLPAQVQLQLLRPVGLPGKTVSVTVPPHTNYVANINALLPNRDVSVVAISDRPVAVERDLTFGSNGAGLTTRTGSTKAATNWLFASGTTENGVQTIFTMMNPGDIPALVTASFATPGGGVLGSRSVYVPARSRATLRLSDVVQGGGISTVVTSDQAVVVERAEYIGSPDAATAGSDVVGRNGAGTRWSFPAGDTSPANASAGTSQLSEVLVLYNPSVATIPVTATVYGTDGKSSAKMYTLTPGAYTVVSVNEFNTTPYHGTVVESGNGQGFIAEQGISSRDGRMLRSTQGIAQ